MATIPTPLITSDPDRLGGTPVFTGTPVPVKTLIEYLEAPDTHSTSSWTITEASLASMRSPSSS